METCNIFGDKKVYDISTPLTTELPVYPGQPRFKREYLLSMDRGERANVSTLKMTAHTGTHVDAEFHFINGGLTIDKIPFNHIIGPAKVFELKVSSKILVADLDKLNIQENDIVLFKTRNSKLWIKKDFTKDYVSITPEAAQFLALKKVSAVGMDYIIPEAADDLDRPVHHILFNNKVSLIEGLDMTGIPSGDYLLICLPLKIIGSDAAPARAILVKE